VSSRTLDQLVSDFARVAASPGLLEGFAYAQPLLRQAQRVAEQALDVLDEARVTEPPVDALPRRG
jgi:hypothetical protein